MSKKLSTIALSTTEVEYKVVAQAICEAVWIEMLLKDLGFTIQRLIQIFCDNISSIMLAKNLVFHTKTKHIEVHYHYVHEKVIEGVVDLKYTKTKD